ncbi:hypothetical protein C2G38_2284400 [Gigaspora rosea]|uniref:Uncharacterized protein n=1 Tax=Gigaspora rosea TaxID=44941 RepID=A0A397VRI2_9GLOM|nr:hypothetical protein C2G38_2284400 [Gigaspora rosea]
MNDHLKALENKPVLDSKTKLNYMSQISYRQKQLEKLKDYKGLKKKLENLIEENDSLQTELFDLKKQSLNKFNKMIWAQQKTIQIDEDLNTSKDNNKTRKDKVDERTKNFKKILESYTMNQVNNDGIEPIDWQRIVENVVDNKMDQILNSIQNKENTIKINYINNRLMIESAFYVKSQNELRNSIDASKEKVKEFDQNATSIRDTLKETIKKTEMMRYNIEIDHKSQIITLDTQIKYLKNDNYKILKEIEKDLEEENGTLSRKIIKRKIDLEYEKKQKNYKVKK